MARLRERYQSEIRKALQEKFSFKNENQIPKVEKIVVNCCTKDAVASGKVVDGIVDQLSAITGQRAVKAL
ncbi:MAG: 50S ribosomal protein L5, partial [Halobacteriovoraceae bacterium]|nr:50S ribosomal protein L5 [Halobacteriovoraceae bacterium]